MIHVRDVPHAESLLRRGMPDLEPAERQRLAFRLAAGFALLVDETEFAVLDEESDDIEPLDPIGPAPEPVPERQTWFELTVVDELGEPLPNVAVSLRVDGEDLDEQTDGEGRLRVDGASTSFATARLDSAALADVLRERWSAARGGEWIQPDPESSTIVRYREGAPGVALRSETPHTIVIQPSLSRARIVGAAFDTNKTFLRPDALPRIRDVVGLYGQHDGAELLVVGHTDTSGDPSVNDPLSLQRAESVVAYLKDDIDAWLRWYDSGVPSSRRWGAAEDHMMLDTVLLRRGEVPDGNPVRHFQESRGLSVDGDIGPQTRRELVTEYMALDGTTLPAAITPVPHGAGENFPLADDGVALQVDAPDGQDDPTDRRVELFFFDAPFGVLPEPPGDNSPAAGAEYLEWLLRSRQVDDFIVTRQLVLAVRVTDAHDAEALAGATVTLGPVEGLDAAPMDAGPVGAGMIATDAFGVSTFFDLQPGNYGIHVSKDGFDASSVIHVLEAEAPPTVVPSSLPRPPKSTSSCSWPIRRARRSPFRRGTRYDRVRRRRGARG